MSVFFFLELYMPWAEFSILMQAVLEKTQNVMQYNKELSRQAFKIESISCSFKIKNLL